MSESITIGRNAALLIMFAVLAAGVLVGGGAFLGGYMLGDEPAPPAPTELAEKSYTVADLEAALAACEIEGVAVESSSATLIGADHSPMKRGCFVAEMGAPELAQQEYGFSAVGTNEAHYLSSADYAWSNVTMSWQQTSQGRDVTITVQ